MGLFTKKDADGLPATFKALMNEWSYPKFTKNPEYGFRVLEKIYRVGVQRWSAGELKGYKDDYSVGEVGAFLDMLDKLQECYEKGTGCAVDKKKAFGVLKTKCAISEDFVRRNALPLNCVNHIPYIWEKMAYYYMTGEGDEKDSELRAKYLMMAFNAWNEKNDEYGISGVRIIRDLMSGYPYPMMELSTYLQMAASLRSRGAMYGAFVMQEIDSMAQLGGRFGYRQVGRSLESDLSFFQAAGEAGNAWANYRLGMCYKYGRGVAKDEDKALSYLEKAGETLHVAASEAWDILNEKYFGKRRPDENRWAMERLEKHKDHLEWDAKGKYPVDKIKNYVEPQYVEPQYVEPVSAEKPASVDDMPNLITDDLGRSWYFKAPYFDMAVYELDKHEETIPGDLGDEIGNVAGQTVYIKSSMISGRTAKTPLRTFHW